MDSRIEWSNAPIIDKRGGQKSVAHFILFSSRRPRKNGVAESLRLFRLGLSVQKIAEKRALKETTVYNHLAEAITQGSLVLTDVIDLSESEIKQIEASLLNLPEEQKNSLKRFIVTVFCAV